VRPLSLALEGFTAFRDRQEIDFEPLNLFVITGPTGAGKTSILDAMVFALYGQVPRLGGKHGTTDLVSLGRAEARVLLEFSIDGKGRYRVARRLSRRAGQSATLERHDGSDWVSICERGGVRECDRALKEILVLEFDSFCKAVVLPQGEFHKFLKGDTAERRQMLVSLLGVGYFQKMASTEQRRSSQSNTPTRPPKRSRCFRVRPAQRLTKPLC
jgi:exonuclease SbcC